MSLSCGPVVVKAPLAGLDDRASIESSTDTGSDLESPPTPSSRRHSTSTVEFTPYPAPVLLAPAPRSVEGGSAMRLASGRAPEMLPGTPLRKQAAPAPKSQRLPAKKQRRQRGGNGLCSKTLPVGSLRSALRNKGKDVMSEMSASNHQPAAIPAAAAMTHDWLGPAAFPAAAAIPPPPGLERPMPVPDRWAPAMTSNMVDDWHYPPACHKYRPGAPTYCYQGDFLCKTEPAKVLCPNAAPFPGSRFQAPHLSCTAEGDRTAIEQIAECSEVAWIRL